jgi:hypothetical protein
MTISVKLRRLVTKRAGFASEYCGVADVDAGGELTIDHFQPSAQGGSDDESNLLYACLRCNLFKADYWPSSPNRPQLWNPRSSPRGDHLLSLPMGRYFQLPTLGRSPCGDCDSIDPNSSLIAFVDQKPLWPVD